MRSSDSKMCSFHEPEVWIFFFLLSFFFLIKKYLWGRISGNSVGLLPSLI